MLRIILLGKRNYGLEQSRETIVFYLLFTWLSAVGIYLYRGRIKNETSCVNSIEIFMLRQTCVDGLQE